MAWAGYLLDIASSHVSNKQPDAFQRSAADISGSWNSAVFTSIPFVTFPVAGVTSDFLEVRDDWTTQRPILDPTIAHNSSVIYALHEGARNFTRYSNLDCMELYIDPRTASSEVVLVAATAASQNNGSSLIFGFISGSDSSQWNAATAWICPNRGDKHDRFCTMEWANEFYDNWTVYQKFTTPDGQSHDVHMTVDHCLVGDRATDTDERCELLYNKGVLFAVCVLTFVDSLLILGILILCRKHTLVHIGDAIADALENGSSFVRHSPHSPAPIVGSWGRVALTRSRWCSASRPRWYQAVTTKAWITSSIMYVCCLLCHIC